MEDLSEFIEKVYEEQAGAPGEFTLNRAKQETLLRHALKDGLDHYTVHLLAAATLVGSDELTVKRNLSAKGPLGLFRHAKTSFFFACEPLSFDALNALPRGLLQSQDRFLFRLSLAINQLAQARNIRFRLDSFGEFTVTSLEQKSGDWSVDQNPKSLDETAKGLRLTLLEAPSYFGREALRDASRFSGVKILWENEVMGARFKNHLTQDALWSRQWQNEEYPLPSLGKDVVAGASISAAAFMLSTLGGSSTLVCFKDNTPLPAIELLPKDAPEQFVPGLLLIINSPDYQVDASQRKLVRNESLYCVVREVLDRLKDSFSEVDWHRKPALTDLILRNAVHRGAPVRFEALKLQSPSSDPSRRFQFANAYSCMSLGRISGNLQWILLYNSTKIGLLSLTGEQPIWEVKEEGHLEIADIHPTSAVVAMAYQKGLLVKDYESDTIRLEQPLLGISDLKFSSNGKLLAVVTSSADSTRAWVFDTHKWEEKFQSVCLGQPMVSFWGDYIFVPDKPMVSTLFPFEDLTRPIQVKCNAASYLTPHRLSPDGQYMAVEMESDSLLVHLPTGSTKPFQGRPVTFGEKSEHLIVTTKKDQHLVYSVPDLSLLHQAKREVDLIYPDGTALKSPQDQFCGALLSHTLTFHLDRRGAKQQPTDKEKVYKLLQTSSGKRTSPLIPRVSLHPRAGQVGFSQRELAIRTTSGWTPLTRFTDPKCSLAPHRIMFESLSGVYSLDRVTGTWSFLKSCCLSGSVVHKEGQKPNTKFLVAPTTGRSGQMSPPRHSWDDNNTHMRALTYQRFQGFFSGSSRMLVDSELGTYRIVGAALSTQTNGEWTIREVRTLLGGKKTQFRRNKDFWKTLSSGSGGQIHPHDPVVVYPTKVSFGLKGLVSNRFELSHQGDWDRSRIARTRVQLSPKGQFVAIHRRKESGIVSYKTGEWLCTFFADCLPVGRHSNQIPIRGQWLNDFTYLHSDQLLISRETENWLSFRRHPLGLYDRIASDGQGDIICVVRDGLVDLFDLKTLKVLATIHISDDQWFVFTNEGLWDCSNDSPIDIFPTPEDSNRRPGLLAEVLTQ